MRVLRVHFAVLVPEDADRSRVGAEDFETDSKFVAWVEAQYQAGHIVVITCCERLEFTREGDRSRKGKGGHSHASF